MSEGLQVVARWSTLQRLCSCGAVLMLLVTVLPAASAARPPSGPGGPGNEIHARVEAGDLAGMQDLLIENPQLVDGRDRSQNTPLIRAARLGHEAICLALLEHGADARATNEAGQTALHAAAIARNPAIAEAILAHGAEVDARDAEGGTALDWAARLRAADVIGLLLDHGASPNPAHTDEEGPLDYVARYGLRDLTDRMLTAGAAVDARDQNGATALFWVARGGVTQRAEVVFAHAQGHAAPSDSGTGDFPGVAELLIGRGADPNAVSSELNHRQTALHVAAGAGRADVAGVLLRHGAKPDPRNLDGETPLYVAAMSGQPECVRVLLVHGAEVDALSGRQWTPLFVTIWNWEPRSQTMHRDVVAQLIDHGANVNVKTPGGGFGFFRDDFSTPLEAAARSGDAALVEFLLNAGADPNVQKKHGKTALEVATNRRDEAIVRLLLEHGAKR